MAPQEGSAPRMGRRHASAAGQRARELPTATGTDTQATAGQQERQRAGDRTLGNRACGGCRRRSGSPRPEACMAGCSGRVSRGTRTRRQPLRRWPRSEAADQSRAGASVGGPADGAQQRQQKRYKAAKDAQGGSQPKDPPPPPPTSHLAP